MSARVFVSYRHDDVADATDRLKMALKDQFGKDNVFADVDDVPVGADFQTVIDEHIERADVFLVVIGRHWLDAPGDDGRRRIESADDFVRIEIEQALRREVTVVPVLVYGAAMPSRAELPESIRPITRINAAELPRQWFDPALRQLVGSIERIAAGMQADHVLAPRKPPPPGRRRGHALPLALLAAAVVVLAGAAALALTGGGNNAHNAGPQQPMTEKQVVRSIEKILNLSKQGRELRMAGNFGDAVKNREKTLRQVQELEGQTKLLGFQLRLLDTAMRFTLKAAKAYEKCGSQNCPSAQSVGSGQKKQEFTQAFNPLAQQFHQPHHWKPDQF